MVKQVENIIGNLRDIEALNMSVQKELAWIWKFHKEENTPISFDHVQFSMLETIGRFEEAIQQKDRS